MSKLTSNISSSYIAAANRMKPQQARERIVAYVESYDDIFFWRSILHPLENERRYFEVMLPSRKNQLERGKKAAILKLFENLTGSNLIACVDADYDYLVQGRTPSSRQMLHTPGVFHTYAYAIENLQCYAPTLHEVCVAITLNDHPLFDMEAYMRRFSEIVYPLFVWSVWYYRGPHFAQFSISDFNRIVTLRRFSIEGAESQLDEFAGKVNRHVMRMQRTNAKHLATYEALKVELASLGITPENTYLYLQGHHLYEAIVHPLIKKICERLIRERENEIRSTSMHSAQWRNELACYSHSIGNQEQTLRKSTGYLKSAIVERIRRQITHFFEQQNH